MKWHKARNEHNVIIISFKGTPVLIIFNFKFESSFVVSGTASIELLYRIRRQQAEYIVNSEYQGEHWYNCLLADSDLVQKFSDAPQGSHVETKYPKVSMPTELRTQSDYCNKRYGLTDLEHLMKVKLYLKRHGRWIPMAVKQNGNCLFASVLAGLDIPKEYTARIGIRVCQLINIYCLEHIVGLVVLLVYYLGCVDRPGSLFGGAFNQLRLATLNIVLTFLY